MEHPRRHAAGVEVVRGLIGICCMAALLANGCAQPSAEPGDSRVDRMGNTPRDAMYEFREALISGDETGMLTRATGTQEDIAHLKGLQRFIVAMIELDERSREAFGESSVDQIRKDADRAFNEKLKSWTPPLESLQRQPLIYESNQVAFLWNPDQQDWARLVREDDTWRVDTSTFNLEDKPEFELPVAEAMHRELAAAVEAQIARIKTGKATAESVELALTNAVFRSIFRAQARTVGEDPDEVPENFAVKTPEVEEKIEEISTQDGTADDDR